MIIPIRCVTCGTVTGDKWRYFQRRVTELQKEVDESGKQKHPAQFYSDGKNVPVTAEFVALGELGLTRWCCRAGMLTHVDTIDKH